MVSNNIGCIFSFICLKLQLIISIRNVLRSISCDFCLQFLSRVKSCSFFSAFGRMTHNGCKSLWKTCLFNYACLLFQSSCERIEKNIPVVSISPINISPKLWTNYVKRKMERQERNQVFLLILTELILTVWLTPVEKTDRRQSWASMYYI
jgi:hypothetical protein